MSDLYVSPRMRHTDVQVPFRYDSGILRLQGVQICSPFVADTELNFVNICQLYVGPGIIFVPATFQVCIRCRVEVRKVCVLVEGDEMAVRLDGF